MQSTLRERYTRSFSAPESTTSKEARIVIETALQHAQREQSHRQPVLNGASSVSSESETCKELGQELIGVSSQIGERKNSKIQEIITKIVTAVTNEDVGGISEPFFEAVESIINRKVDVDTFINVMVFCITLVRRYRATSPSNMQDRAVWMTEQVYELMTFAYQRYRINDWIQEQGGWKGVLRLVRMRYQTFTDYATQRLVSNSGATAGAVVLIGTVAFIVWYNW